MTFDQWIALTTVLIAIAVAALRAVTAVAGSEKTLAAKQEAIDLRLQAHAALVAERLATIQAASDRKFDELRAMMIERFDQNAKIFDTTRTEFRISLEKMYSTLGDHEKRVFHLEETADLWLRGHVKAANGADEK